MQRILYAQQVPEHNRSSKFLECVFYNSQKITREIVKKFKHHLRNTVDAVSSAGFRAPDAVTKPKLRSRAFLPFSVSCHS